MDNDFKRFFSKWFYLSIILVLIGFVVSDVSISPLNNKLVYLRDMLSLLLQSVGVAVFVGNIFTFHLSTKEFFDYIQDGLLKIIVSKEFIDRLNSKDRKDLLKIALKPSKETSSIYSGITRYFDKYIDDSMKLFGSIFRSNVVITVIAKYNENKKIIVLEEDLDYRVYRVDAEFEQLRCSFEDESSKHIHTKVVAPSGEELTLNSKDQLNNDTKDSDPTAKKTILMKIPEKFQDNDYLDINRSFIEYGEDHWALFTYKAIQPSDGLIINLRCEGDVKIKFCNTYGVQQNFKIDQKDDHVKITFNDWLSPGFGVVVLVSMPDKSVILVKNNDPEVKGNKIPAVSKPTVSDSI